MGHHAARAFTTEQLGILRSFAQLCAGKLEQQEPRGPELHTKQAAVEAGMGAALVRE